MTIFQKLFWLTQMGVEGFCAETKRVFAKEVSVSPKKEMPLQIQSKSALSKTAMHALKGIGVLPAQVLCLLNAPNAEEDKSGQCLVGPEGEMTKKMLSSIGLDLAKNTYVAYLSPWRPPGNRLLTQVEIKEGLALLDQCIAEVKPTWIFVFGSEPLRALISGKTLSALRHGHATYKDYPVYATFSASDLIKNPAHRRQAWEDLKAFRERMEKA